MLEVCKGKREGERGEGRGKERTEGRGRRGGKRKEKSKQLIVCFYREVLESEREQKSIFRFAG